MFEDLPASLVDFMVRNMMLAEQVNRLPENLI